MSYCYKSKCVIGVVVLLLYSVVAFNQTPVATPPVGNKGKFYAYWGWNRAWYTKSDIHFTGKNYDFVLEDVIGKDRPSEYTIDNYLNPINLTVPQTQFRVGYFISDHYDISFGIDHMKYVMQQDQEVIINGYINESNTQYDGTYHNEKIKLLRDFLEYEHTDGLTYFNFELRRSDKLVDLTKLLHFDMSLNFTEGAGIGFMFPRTDAKLLYYKRNNEFHVAGYGVAILAGLNLSFLKHFFIQFETKAGYINLSNVRTTSSEDDKATQSLNFLQTNLVFGGKFRLGSK